MSDDEDNEGERAWLLGFLEEPQDASSLLRHRFPSKVGGCPAWLDPVCLPSADQLRCPFTSQPRQFLLQIYAAPPAGSAEDHPGAFHRSISVFVSPKGGRLSEPGAVAAFRCQLPRENAYYDAEPSEDLLPRQLEPPQQRRSLEGDPWQVVLKERDLKGQRPAVGPAQFKEWEVVVEPETDGEEEEGEEGGDAAPASAVGALADDGPAPSHDLAPAALDMRVRQYASRVAKEGELDDAEALQIDEAFRDQVAPNDRLWAHFQAVTSAQPGSVLRYCVDDGAAPLWGRCDYVPGHGIPPCPLCGAPRRFEFQVLPQLLSYLALDNASDDAPDWLTIAVYTCSNSCVPPEGMGYASEYVWCQPPLADADAATAV